MTAQNTLEQHGKLSANPFAELLVEIVQAKFDGSLRVTQGSQKSIIYFRTGQIVYAASNSKDLRLFNLLLRKKLIDTKVISRNPHFANDVEFAASLIGGRVVEKTAIDECFTSQMTDIVVDVLTWSDGQWTFSALVRARDGLAYSIDAYQILIDYARCTPAEQIFRRFKSVEESFTIVPERRLSVHLQPHESFVLARFEGQSLTINQLKDQCSMPEGGMFQALYVLWLGGLLVRRDWNSAFSATKVGEILTARIAKVKEASETEKVQAQPIAPQPAEDQPPAPEPLKLPEVTLSLAQYLHQIEKAETHYDALGISTDADSAVVKHHYFSLAKMFHPDRHHRESEAMLKRIQSAFTVLTHAHETLRTPEARSMYDSKMYKEIEAREKRRAAGQPDVDVTDRAGEHGLENFEEGLNMIAEHEYEAASAYLARAVHYSPQNALYHAYFGMAMSKADDKYRHKAEGELQTAAKLDPKNPKIRMMLVDFLIENKMAKRAEGELKRFLELVPNNKEATSALAKLSA
ncbi:MAG: DnaJ domain-containing protein [Pyrinomonadaceae bacterium]